MVWVLDYLDDIESDMSAFHRVDDIYEMDGPTFFSRAVRLTAYAGVMQARAVALREQEEGRTSYTPPNGGTPQRAEKPTQVPESVVFAQLADGWAEHVVEGEGAE